MQPLRPRRATPTGPRWMPVDELFAAVDAAADADETRRPVSNSQLARALKTPAPRDPLPDDPAPRRRRKGPHRDACLRVAGAWVKCCGGDEPGCPCDCHVQIQGAPLT